jgi:hypothetical protein
MDRDRDRDKNRDRDEDVDGNRDRERDKNWDRDRAGQGRHSSKSIGPGEETLLFTESHPDPVRAVQTYTSSSIGAKTYHSQS